MFSIQKIGVIGRTYRHLNRYRQILSILIKYGLGDIVERLNIDQYLEVGLTLLTNIRRERIEKLTSAERTRIAFEEMGPTFIKFGQIISTHPGLIPANFIKELAKLQDEVPPFPFSQVTHAIESALGVPANELFEFIDPQPLASASIGQVHKARLVDDGDVAVKIQRPGIKKIIEVDLEIMLHIATLMERHIEEMTIHQPVKIVEEFARTIEKEVDYTIEATNIERFSRHFMKDSDVYIPKVFREYSSSQVLTMEFLQGVKISDTLQLDASGLDRKKITARGANIILKMIFNHGFFHADPHPGNIFALPRNVIGLVDFGMVGSIDLQTRELFVDLIDSVVQRNPQLATQVILKLTDWEEEPQTRTLERDISEFMGMHLYKPLKEVEITKLLQQLLEISFRHRLKIPPDIFLMIKTLGTVEGIGHQLDPDFDMISQATPFVAQIKLNRFHPKRMARDILGIAIDYRHFLQQFPMDLLKITTMVKQRRLSIRFEHHGLERPLATFDQISNRISFSIIIAALLVGSALIVISNTPPLFYGISLIGIVGFFIAAIMGMWLLIAIIRKGRL